MIKTRQDAIETLCELQSHVSANVMGYDRPNNCFCGEHKGEFRSCGESIGFIVRWTSFGIGVMRPYVWAKRWVRRIRRAWEDL